MTVPNCSIHLAGNHLDESIRQAQAFQHVRKTEGANVCPSGWHPGDPVLKQGPDPGFEVFDGFLIHAAAAAGKVKGQVGVCAVGVEGVLHPGRAVLAVVLRAE